MSGVSVILMNVVPQKEESSMASQSTPVDFSRYFLQILVK